MNDSENRVIDIGTRLKAGRERDRSDMSREDIQNLALQAINLPTTLSRSQIEELGLAVLIHTGQHDRI